MINVIVFALGRLKETSDRLYFIVKLLSFGVHNIALAVNAHCGKALLILYEV